VPWLPIAVTAGALAAAAAVGAALAYPLVWATYDTAWPESMFRTSALIGMAIAVLFQWGGAMLALGTLAACFPQAAAVTRASARRAGAGGAVLAAVAALGASAALAGLVAAARSWAPRLFPDAPVGVPDSVATAVPGLAAVAGALAPAALLLALVGAAVHLWLHARHAAARPLLAVGVLVALIPGGAEASAGELLAGVAQAALSGALAVVVARFVIGANPVAWAAAAVALAAMPGAVALVEQPGAAYQVQGWVALAVVVAVAALLLLPRGRGAVQ
jgi:hypothetical protein